MKRLKFRFQGFVSVFVLSVLAGKSEFITHDLETDVF